MHREERDPTDLGLSVFPSEEDVRGTAVPVEEPQAEPASRDHVLRVIDRAASEHGWSRRPRPRKPCPRASCQAAAEQWCRRSVRSGRVFGYVHEDR